MYKKFLRALAITLVFLGCGLRLQHEAAAMGDYDEELYRNHPKATMSRDATNALVTPEQVESYVQTKEVLRTVGALLENGPFPYHAVLVRYNGQDSFDAVILCDTLWRTFDLWGLDVKCYYASVDQQPNEPLKLYVGKRPDGFAPPRLEELDSADSSGPDTL